MAVYICIDLKSFYASVECVERGLDPLNTNLVVADAGRTEKTICLAVTPALKQYGIPGRARLFEVIETVRQVNAQRLQKLSNHEFTGKSCLASELGQNPSLQLDFVIAPPQMAHYMEISTKIYEIYLRYIAPEDIHVYSIDEVFIDVTGYLKTYHCTPQELARKMIREVLQETGVTATAGIGTNLYLAKIAMDIVAKKIPADENGVRIAELDEMSYREKLWSHTPLTDFWRIGSGYARRLEKMQIFTMGDLARFSEHGEDLLFRMFGVAAELLIDHAWGYEPCTMQAIKSYQPKGHSISQGQVLPCPYDFEKGRLIVREMTELLVLDLVRKKMVADQIVLMVGYDHTGIPETYRGELKKDRYGKKIPKAAHGSVNLGKQTSSTKCIMEKVLSLYDRIVDPELQVRRMSITANHVIPEGEVQEEVMQYSLFDDVEAQEQKRKQEQESLKKEHQLQEAILSIKDRYGKNAILKGMNFREGATTIERNEQVGGHKA
ncbi:Y-family DNA polymerase [Ruminococcus callidus]|uniref:Y-family DNA polymerase n=1 Tax=Ruminococcus callidus TaxID=40519 RepID=UPI00351FBE1D